MNSNHLFRKYEYNIIIIINRKSKCWDKHCKELNITKVNHREENWNYVQIWMQRNNLLKKWKITIYHRVQKIIEFGIYLKLNK